jgi:hypothetical protein
MNKVMILSSLLLFVIVTSLITSTYYPPTGKVFYGPGGSTFERGQATSISVVWDDYYLGTIKEATIGCDPDIIICWEIMDNGESLEVGMLMHPPTDSTVYFHVSTIDE